MKKIVNCTPHAINLLFNDDSGTIIPPSGVTPTVEMIRTKTESINEIDVHMVTSGPVSGMPDAAEDTIYIVSQLVANAAPQRRDLVFPLDLIRDDKGRVVGCRGFGQVPRHTTKCCRCNDTGIFQADDMGSSLCICSCPAGRVYESERR